MLTVQPRTCELGVMDVTKGVGNLTLNPSASIPDCPSPLTTTTFHRPGAAPEGRDIEQVIRFEDPTLTPVAGISGSPDLVSLTAAPLINPFPPTETGTTVEPTVPDEGDTPLTITPALLTINPSRNTAALPSGVVTTIFLAPSVAPARLMVQVIWFWFTTRISDAVISGADELLKITDAPFWKPEPDSRVIVTDVPARPESGLIPVMTGPGSLTVNPLARTPDCPSIF
jgi:hypothetical protein